MGFAMFTGMPKSLGNIKMLGTMKLIAWKPHVQMYLCKQCCTCKMYVCWAYKLCLQMSTVSQSNLTLMDWESVYHHCVSSTGQTVGGCRTLTHTVCIYAQCACASSFLAQIQQQHACIHTLYLCANNIIKDTNKGLQLCMFTLPTVNLNCRSVT